MKTFTNLVMILCLRPHIFNVLFIILVTAGPYMLYAQPCVTEICNGIDDDCDGLLDEGVLTTYYNDWDLDGFYSNVTILACTAPLGWIGGDNPGACFDVHDYDNLILCWDGWEEVCNGIDDDGNGLVDDDDPGLWGAVWWYADSDGDGYGDPYASIYSCTQPSGYLPYPNPYSYPNFIDCDDTDPYINPGAEEICNGIDDNCDGLIDPENCNSIDTDCDGVTDDFDICPGGDDSVDNNEDGIPDCNQLLNYNDYIPDWRCATNKIYVCHNDNNPQTICIDANALLPAHFNHGDKIGPCTSCPEFMISPGNDGIADAFGLTIFPNSADNAVNFHLQDLEDKAAELILFDYSGKVIWQKILEAGQHELILDVSGSTFVSGVYFVQVNSSGNVLIKRLVVSK